MISGNGLILKDLCFQGEDCPATLRWLRHISVLAVHLNSVVITCAEIELLVSAFVDNQVPAELSAPFFAHLATCDECRGYVQNYRMVVVLLQQERRRMGSTKCYYQAGDLSHERPRRSID